MWQKDESSKRYFEWGTADEVALEISLTDTDTDFIIKQIYLQAECKQEI